MKHTTSTNCLFAISDFPEMKIKVLNWIQRFGTFCFLDNHQYHIAPQTLECLVGAGIARHTKITPGHSLDQLQELLKRNRSWLFGHLAYDLKNEIEPLQSGHTDHVGFPDLFFFEPEVVIRMTETEMTITGEDPEGIFDAIQSCAAIIVQSNAPVHINQRFTREEYITTIEKLRQHILRGDCYEINFCQEFYAENTPMDPLAIYSLLSTVSPNPFSALYKTGDQWLICASPERFIRREDRTILSQPIKGTSKRFMADPHLDQRSREELYHSTKDRSENVMVVDLVRNDLAKICEEGSVTVDELYGIYSFPQVHQMISTVSGRLRDDVSFIDIIKATFPMGSMTGAPKRRVMELIEQYEKTKRGIFSGALGYISPTGDFDFNVVIRSIMYNERNHYISFQAGSGITFYSDAAMEWEECMLKAAAIKNVLGKDHRDSRTDN